MRQYDGRPDDPITVIHIGAIKTVDGNWVAKAIWPYGTGFCAVTVRVVPEVHRIEFEYGVLEVVDYYGPQAALKQQQNGITEDELAQLERELRELVANASIT